MNINRRQFAEKFGDIFAAIPFFPFINRPKKSDILEINPKSDSDIYLESGRKFGKLTILYRSQFDKSIYYCGCECGEIIQISVFDLILRTRTSCGCQHR